MEACEDLGFGVALDPILSPLVLLNICETHQRHVLQPLALEEGFRCGKFRVDH